MGYIHFIDGAGRRRYGVERDAGQAELLTGSPEAHGADLKGELVDIARLLSPIVPTNIFCIGLNYKRHAAETGLPIPEHPVIFMKPTSAVIGPGDAIEIPKTQMSGPEVDFEGELAVVIGKLAKDVEAARAMDHVLGFTCANDVSARRWQKRGGGGQWIKGKGFDTFCPLGPRIVPPEDLPVANGLSIRTTVNGEVMQDSSTFDMIFSVEELISRISRDTTLLPGTVILTGTPEGVGFTRTPPRYLERGDEVVVEIQGIGRLVNPVTQAG